MIAIKQLHDKRETGDEMKRLVENFSGDIRNFQLYNTPLDQLSLDSLYDTIKAIPYREDTEGVEVVSRPFHLLDAPWQGWDCKKKAIVIASWLRENNIPYRFVAVSTRSDGQIHHCVVQAYLGEQWRTIDATYERNRLFEERDWTRAETLNGTRAGRSPVLVSMYGDGDPSLALANEFMAYRRDVLGDSSAMGGIVTGIVAGIVAIASVIITSVASKRTQDREFAQQDKILEESRRIYSPPPSTVTISTTPTPTDTRATAETDLVTFMKKWGIPVAAAIGLNLLA